MIHVSNLTFPRVCHNCGEPFNTTFRSKGVAKFCSDKCCQQSRGQRETARMREPGQDRKPYSSRSVGVLYQPTLESGLVDAGYLSRIMNCHRQTVYNRYRRGMIPQPIAGTIPLKWRMSDLKEWYDRLKTTTTEGLEHEFRAEQHPTLLTEKAAL